MKKSLVIVAALLTLAGVSSWAQIIAFPVKLKAGIAYPTTNGAATVHLGVTEANLLSSPANHLVVVADLNVHAMRLVEATSSNTLVQTLMTSRRLAIMPDGTFSTGLQFDFTLPAASGGIGVNGDVNLTGKITKKKGLPKSLSAAVIGVLNDMVDGDVTDLDITIKGKLTPAGAPFDGTPLIP